MLKTPNFYLYNLFALYILSYGVFPKTKPGNFPYGLKENPRGGYR